MPTDPDSPKTARLRVLIPQRVLCDYRVPFFDALDVGLADDGIVLTVIAGAPRPGEALVDARARVRCCVASRNVALGPRLYWTSGALRLAARADLAVVEHAAAPLHSHILLLRRALARAAGRRPRTLLACWGHGDTFQGARPSPLREAAKRILARSADWWFAYTDVSARRVRDAGFPAERITVVRNAIDTDALRRARAGTGASALADLARRLFGAADPAPTGVFCARLTRERHLAALFAALDRLRALLPSFRMVFVGDGPERSALEAFCAGRPWAVRAGAIHGDARVPYLALGDVWLQPGGLGLSILDAFALGIPVAAMRGLEHGPEIAYLRDGVNGLATDPDATAYAAAVADVLRDPARLSDMRRAARLDAEDITVAGMAARFREGILRCLASRPGAARVRNAT